MSDAQLREWAETFLPELSHETAVNELGPTSVGILSDDEWSRLASMLGRAHFKVVWL